MSDSKASFDLIVIGGGPAGYIAAIRAAQLGLSVACVERDLLGGTCLNWGCIPTKALLAASEFYLRLTRHADQWGIHVDPDHVSHDWSKVVGRSRSVAGQLNRGVQSLFKKHKITHIQGHAHIKAPGLVDVYDKDDAAMAGGVTQTLQAPHIVIATGAAPRPLPAPQDGSPDSAPPFDGHRVINSKDAMTLQEQPAKLLIIGAGAIGMEFAYFYNAFGTEVTVVEMLDRLLPIEDDDVSKAIAKAYKKHGITTHTAHMTLSVELTEGGVKARVAPVQKPEAGQSGPPRADESKAFEVQADKVLVAIGVQGRFDGLFADNLGIETVKGHIKTDYVPGQPDQDPTYRTSVEGIYAVGDVIGPPWLAHVAMEEAVNCVEQIAATHFDKDVHHHAIDYLSVPGCTYCSPQVASIGFTERALIERGLNKDEDYAVGTFPFLASGKAQAMGETDGFAKLLTDAKTGEILGCHMVGENVTELIAQWGLARKLEATATEVVATMHAHPTMSEASHEAALGTLGRMLHY